MNRRKAHLIASAVFLMLGFVWGFMEGMEACWPNIVIANIWLATQ